MGKQIFTFLLVSVIVSLAHAQTKQPLDLPVCQVARSKTAYTDIVQIPEDVKSYITEYKKSWIDLCDQKQSASIHQTLTMARSLEEKFKPILYSTEKVTSDSKTDWKEIESIHTYFASGLPKFVPAFEGSIIEYEYFQPRFSDFESIAKYGNAEDKLFFELYADLRGRYILPPWFEMTWDYGGCLRFGEYNWIQAFQKLKKGDSIKSVQYKKIMAEQEKSLTETLEELYHKVPDNKFADICTCKNKDAVESDLEKLVAYLKTENSHDKLVEKLQETLKAISAGQIPVLSEAEKHCSGG